MDTKNAADTLISFMKNSPAPRRINTKNKG